MMELALSLTSA